MTEELTPAERAALAARSWYDRVFQRGEPLRDQATKLLYVQLGQIYAEEEMREPDDATQPRVLCPVVSGPCPGDDRGVLCSIPCHKMEDVPDEQLWIERTMVDVRDGDTIRMPGQPGTERAVLSVSPVLQHHIHPSDAEWHPKPAGWSEILLSFTANPKQRLSFKPSMPVEIFMLRSELTAMEALGGWANRIRVTSAGS